MAFHPADGRSMGRGAALARGAGQGARVGLTRRSCLLMGLGAAVAACQPLYSSHGYIPTDEDLAVLEVGVDTRESVSATIGRPSASGLLGDEAWYYVQSRYRVVGGAAPQEIDREVVAITFDAEGKVANIERFGLDRGQIVPISRRVTTTNIRGRGVLSQIFGNIGKLNTDNLFK